MLESRKERRGDKRSGRVRGRREETEAGGGGGGVLRELRVNA